MIRDARAQGKRRISARKILTCRSEKRKLLRSNRLPRFPALCNGNWAGEIYTFSAPSGGRRATKGEDDETDCPGRFSGASCGTTTTGSWCACRTRSCTNCWPTPSRSASRSRFSSAPIPRRRSGSSASRPIATGEETPAENPRPHGPFRRPERPGARPRGHQVPRPEVRLPRQGAQPDRARGRSRRNPRAPQGQHEGADDDRPLPVPRADRLGLQHPVRAVHRLLLRRAQRRPALPAGVRPVPADARRGRVLLHPALLRADGRAEGQRGRGQEADLH